MEKRLPLAILLSVLVLFAWSILFKKPAPVSTKTAPVPAGAEPLAQQAQREEEAPPLAPPTADVLAASEEQTLVLDLFLDRRAIVGSDLPASAVPGRPGRYQAVFTNRGARLLELRFRDFFTRAALDEREKADPANWLALLQPLTTSREGSSGSLVFTTQPSSAALAPGGLENALWQMEEIRDPQAEVPSGVRFRYGPGTGVVFEKRVAFEPGTWHVLLSLSIENQSALAPGPREFRLLPAGFVPPELGDQFYPEPRAVAIGFDRGDARNEIDWQSAPGAEEGKELEVPTPVVLTGVHNKYFAFLLREEAHETKTLLLPRYYPVEDPSTVPARKLIAVEVPLALRLPEAGSAVSYDYVVYAGPKQPGPFVADSAAHELVIDKDLGSMSTIGRALLAVLRFFHGLTNNWGVAIILLTLLVRIVLFPLNRRSQTAMARYGKKMKRVQPKLEEIKQRFQGDPKKLREAQARLMQEEGAFPPLGGCLPVFLQLPIFFGLFSALRTSFDLRQAPFALWIDDLSRPDQLAKLGLRLPGFLPDIEYLNLLPILMVVLWILQQAGMPKPADEQAARMQKMMMFMPVVFGFLLYNYAAGLSLYMITTSTLGIVEQKVIKKLWPIDDREQEKKSKGCAPFAGILKNLAEKQREQMQKSRGMHAEMRRQGERRKKRR